MRAHDAPKTLHGLGAKIFFPVGKRFALTLSKKYKVLVVLNFVTTVESPTFASLGDKVTANSGIASRA